jgi:hypothetical protein
MHGCPPNVLRYWKYLLASINRSPAPGSRPS